MYYVLYRPGTHGPKYVPEKERAEKFTYNGYIDGLGSNPFAGGGINKAHKFRTLDEAIEAIKIFPQYQLKIGKVVFEEVS